MPTVDVHDVLLGLIHDVLKNNESAVIGSSSAVSKLLPAMAHTTEVNAKLVRPTLTVAAANAVSQSTSLETGAAVATAVELIHTYSLIHLPSPPVLQPSHLHNLYSH